ncbi:hypothetical protein ACT453_33515 [Bacillus sp. D-CC]
MGNISVLIGMGIGYIIAAFSGLISLDKIDESPWLGWVMLHSGSRGLGNVIGTYFIWKL